MKTRAKLTIQELQTSQRGVDATLRHEDIAVAAYYLAERRGFANGSDVADWLEAEKLLQGPKEVPLA